MTRDVLTPARRAAFLWLAGAAAGVGTAAASPARAEMDLRELLDDKLRAVETWLREDNCPALLEDLRKLQEVSPIGSRFAAPSTTSPTILRPRERRRRGSAAPSSAPSTAPLRGG